MILTCEQEAELMERYDKLIWNTVHHFKRRNTSRLDNKDDLHQEATIVFLEHIRSCKDEEELARTPFMDMHNAMCRYTIGEQVLSYPKRTTDTTVKTSGDVRAVDYQEVDMDDRYFDTSIDQAVENMTMKSFLESLSHEDRRIVEMKMLGYRNGEVARETGLTDVNITRRLKRLKNKYQSYVS